MTRLAAALVVLLLVLPACQPRRDGPGAGPGGGPGDPLSVPSGDPRELALAVTVVSAWPSFVVPGAPTPPRVRIAGDGSFRADVLRDEEWVSLTGRLDEQVLGHLLDAAAALPDEGYGEPGLDGSSTLLDLGVGSGRSTPRQVDVWVPEADGYEGLAQRYRDAFVDLLDRVDEAVSAVGEPWEPQDYLLLTSEITVRPDDGRRPAWPLTDVDPRGSVRDGLGCQPVDAAVAARLRPALEAPLLDETGFTHDGTAYGALLLPVLTDETCAEVRPYRWPLG